jgi:transposase
MLVVSQFTIAGRPPVRFNRWDNQGLRGLYNANGQGRKSILTDADIEQVKQRVRENRQQLKEVRTQLKEDLSKKFSDKSLKRFLKSLVANGNDFAKV